MFKKKISKKNLSQTRAWSVLTKRDETYVHAKIATNVVLQKLRLPSNAFWGLFPKFLAAQLDQRVRQIITGRHLLGPIQREIMVSTANIGRPGPIAIPRVWREKLRDDGVDVPNFRSSILLMIDSARLMVAGVRQIYRLLRIDNSEIVHQFKGRPEVVLIDKSVHSYQPDDSEVSETSCFTNWMAKRLAAENITGDMWVHVPQSKSRTVGKGVFRVGSAFPELPNKWKKFVFLIQSARATLLVALRWMAFGWWAPALLSDAVEIIYLQHVAPNSLAKSYWFNNNKALERPLWTLFLEEKDIVVRMAFLSTNISFHWLVGQPAPDIHPFYQLMNWHNYVAWDSAQAEVITEMIGDGANIEIVGPIPSGDNGKALPSLPERTIAVFDASPHRSTRMAGLGYLAPYFVVENSLRFIDDLIKITRETGWSIAFKKKRDNDPAINRQYLNALRQLQVLDNVIMIDPNISADRLVDASSAVIGVPFTSPCVMAKLIDKPSAFYDPTHKIVPTRKCDHGVDFLAGVDALREWIGGLDTIAVSDKTQGRLN